ncbi:hypothetical protein P7K49_029651 [Saguinus oedipus]|uniref:Uncharacterized protein n=1 Tax=Saguinus oedipus TaxID=9490 RepID=A0ABQ9U7T3_SAGOE|nr:hypothetical protein P7K49_029651 [Saguinus oedipus]
MADGMKLSQGYFSLEVTKGERDEEKTPTWNQIPQKANFKPHDISTEGKWEDGLKPVGPRAIYTKLLRKAENTPQILTQTCGDGHLPLGAPGSKNAAKNKSCSHREMQAPWTPTLIAKRGDKSGLPNVHGRFFGSSRDRLPVTEDSLQGPVEDLENQQFLFPALGKDMRKTRSHSRKLEKNSSFCDTEARRNGTERFGYFVRFIKRNT